MAVLHYALPRETEVLNGLARGVLSCIRFREGHLAVLSLHINCAVLYCIVLRVTYRSDDAYRTDHVLCRPNDLWGGVDIPA